MKYTYTTPSVIILCIFYFLLGMAAWKYGSVIVGWVR